jgi:RNA polymerase primary sigma factor
VGAVKLPSVRQAGTPELKAGLAEFLAHCRREAVRGVVPEGVFLEGAHRLGLGDAQRERLRDELARLGLPVHGTHVHVEGDKRRVKKVARAGEENVSARVRAARELLSRYADSQGRVSAQAVDGVAALAGLRPEETAVLRAGARIREDAPAVDPAPGGVSSSGTEPPHSGGAGSGPAAAGATRTGSRSGTEGASYAAAVAAALAVLEEDRFLRRPENRLLDAEAEVGLAVLVRGGPDRAGREPEQEELSALPPGDIRVRARDCLVLHNQRLVHAQVRPFLDQGLEYEDLFQHGVLGLMRAARKFDPTMGNKFSTYATWWIRQSIGRALADEGAAIRVPVHMHAEMHKVAWAERTLQAQGRPARVADVAILCDLPLRKVEQIRRLSRCTDSLDRVLLDGATLGVLIGERETLPSPESAVLDALDQEQIMAVVAGFEPRERRILVRRLGLDGDEPSTLDELGAEFGVTRERIRQIQVKLLPVLEARLRKAGLLHRAEPRQHGRGSERGREPGGSRPGARVRSGPRAPRRRGRRTRSREPDRQRARHL